MKFVNYLHLKITTPVKLLATLTRNAGPLVAQSLSQTVGRSPRAVRATRTSNSDCPGIGRGIGTKLNVLWAHRRHMTSVRIQR